MIPLFFLLQLFHMQGTPMSENRPMRQASGGTWNIQLNTTHLRVEKQFYFLYNDMAAILNFSLHSCYLLSI